MKTILFSVIAVFFSIAVYSDTIIPAGPISGIWTQDGSPYLIEGLTWISDGTTLTIKPGVRVEWQGSYTMHVQGQILAEGTEADSIIFTAANPDTGFRSIRFLGTPLGNDTSLFKYCIFRHGRVYGEWTDNCGGAITAINYSKFIVDHCLFDDNKATVVNVQEPGGGAIALWTSSPEIRNSKFINNISYGGGAICCWIESNPIIENNLFTDNTATGFGGAIFCHYSHPQIHHNLFYDNTAQFDGGAIELYEYSSPDIINNTIAHNIAEGVGGGIDIFMESHPQIKNNILWGNTAADGNQIYINADCVPNFRYSDIQGGKDSIGGIPVTGAYDSCIDCDPLFEDALTGNYHLTPNSCCIDAGCPSSPLDPDGTRCDIGAFYYDQPSGISGFGIQDSEFRIECYPNPVNEISNIKYIISNIKYVRLSVIDIHGKEIISLVNETQSAGEYIARFDASDLPSSIYFIYLQVDDQIVTKKIIKK